MFLCNCPDAEMAAAEWRPLLEGLPAGTNSTSAVTRIPAES